MKLKQVDLHKIRIPLCHHFETSYGRWTSIDKVIVKSYFDEGIVFSECVADPHMGYTYETPETAAFVLKQHILPLLWEKSISGPEEYWRLVEPLRGHPMTKACLDNAFWILKARLDGQSLAAATGGQRTTIDSGGVSVGIQDSEAEFMEIVKERIGRGARRIKLKIKPGWDRTPLECFRKHWPEMDLMVDANNAYDYHRDREFLTSIDQYNLLMFEQPLDAKDIYYHARLQEKIDTPVCLDESIHHPYHARLAVEIKACKIINIKQARCGGLTPAKEIHDIATANGVDCWCGGMIETGIGMTVNTAVASWPNMTYPNAVYANAGFLQEDLIDPPTVVDEKGQVAVPSAAGLGVEVNEKTLDRFTVEHKELRP